jgi:hypothetical protein
MKKVKVETVVGIGLVAGGIFGAVGGGLTGAVVSGASVGLVCWIGVLIYNALAK